MTGYDIRNLIGTIDLDNLKDDFSEISSMELVNIYKSLIDVIGVCVKCSNIPSVSFVLSQFSYACSLEITNRFLFSHDDSLRNLDIPVECLPDFSSWT